MENLEKPKPLQEVQPQKIEEKPVEPEQLAPNPEVLADEERQRAIRAEEDAKALKKVRETLGITQPEKADTQDNVIDSTQDKIQKEFQKELGKSMSHLSGEIQEFEDALKLNKFNRISFQSEDLRTVATDESVDFKKATQAIDSLQMNLRKDFMPRDEREKLSIEPFNFTRIIDSLDSLKGALIGIRSKIDKRPITDSEFDQKKLSESLTKAINASRRKMDDMEEVQTALRRYTGR